MALVGCHLPVFNLCCQELPTPKSPPQSRLRSWVSCCLTLSWVGNPTAISPTPSASSTEPMPSASSEPSRAAHSATSVPSSESSSSDSSEGPGRRRGPSHLLASQRPSAAPEPRNNNVWKKTTRMRRFRSCCLGRELCRWKRTRLSTDAGHLEQ